MSDTQTDAVLREWRESARYWEKHSGTIRAMFAPVTRALIKDAGIVKGQSVLDVAGGATPFRCHLFIGAMNRGPVQRPSIILTKISGIRPNRFSPAR